MLIRLHLTSSNIYLYLKLWHLKWSKQDVIWNNRIFYSLFIYALCKSEKWNHKSIKRFNNQFTCTNCQLDRPWLKCERLLSVSWIKCTLRLKTCKCYLVPVYTSSINTHTVITKNYMQLSGILHIKYNTLGLNRIYPVTLLLTESLACKLKDRHTCI